MLLALILFPVFGNCYTHVEVYGLIRNLPFSEFIKLENVQQIVQSQISEEAEDLEAHLESISDGGESVGYKAVISSAQRTVDDMLTILKRLPTVDPVIWWQIDHPRPKRSIANTISNSYEPDLCKNGGTTVDNKTCICPPYTTGSDCRSVICMNNGKHGNGLRPCVCPPGFEGLHCENRGCRPPVEDNRIGKKRSFVLVFPTTQSMMGTRDVIANSVTQTVNQLQANEPGYIDNYILVLYYKSNIGQVFSPNTYTDLTTFVDKIRTADVWSNGTESRDQPTLQAIRSALEQQPIHPDSIVLVFTDRLESDAAPATYVPFLERSQYLNVATDALYWKSKIFFYLIQDGQYGPMDQTSEGYNAFRQVASFTHGETFLISQNEVEKIFTNDIPFFYKPQNIAVRKYTLCKDIVITLSRDYQDQYAYVLITADVNGALTNSTPFYVVPTVADGIITPAVQRNNYAIFSLPGNMTFPDQNYKPHRIDSVRVGTIPYVQCSVTAFVSSDFSALLTFAENSLSDGGSVYNYAEGVNRVTGAQFGFEIDTKKTPYYEPISLTDGTSLQSNPYPFSGKSRPGCSFGFAFETQQPCQIGPFTQKLTLPMAMTSGATNITRHLPGVCVHHAYQAPNYTTTQPTQATPPNSCYQMNTADIDEPRLHEFQQIVFVVEISSQMKTAVTNLLNILPNVLQTIDQSQWNRQYTLVTYDKKGWRAQVDDWDQASFSQKCQDKLTLLLQSAVDTGNTPLYTGDAVQGAMSLKILSPMIIHVFASAQGGLRSSQPWFTPTDVQVNIYQIDENTNADPTFALSAQALQLQSSGRYMLFNSASISSMSSLLTSSTHENSLISHDALEDCSTDIHNFYASVEKSGTAFSLVVVGRDVGAMNNRVMVQDGGLSLLTKNQVQVQAKSPNSVAWRIDTQNTLPGNWTIFVSTTSGPCYVQARVESAVNMAIGFTSDFQSDVPKKVPYLRAATDGKPFQVVARVVTNPVVLDRVVLEDIPVEAQWNTTLYQNSSTNGIFTMRDLSRCAYQFISSPVYQPLYWDLKVTVFGREIVGEERYPFQRIFWYSTYPGYQLCRNGIMANGQCSCAAGYTGEFCYDPICSPMGVPSNGICACQEGFTGEFCEKTYNASSTTPCPTDTSTGYTNPTATTPKGGSSLRFLTTLVLLSLSYCLI